MSREASAIYMDMGGYPPDVWIKAIRAVDPHRSILHGPLTADQARSIGYAVVWKPSPGVLKTLPNLACTFSLGAGVDGILADQDYPRTVPLCRMADPTLTQAMSEYVVLHVLAHHRRKATMDEQQRRKVWRIVAAPRASSIRVGMMGLGVLGLDASRVLSAIGYTLHGWSRTPKTVAGMECHSGAEGLATFLQSTDILVCLLPLTSQTKGILNAQTFALLPARACVINCARGGHLIEADLIAALDSGHLSGATLDVFAQEPLDPASPLWSHPKVTLTPHCAAISDPNALAQHIAVNIARIEAGGQAHPLVDFAQGY